MSACAEADVMAARVMATTIINTRAMAVGAASVSRIFCSPVVLEMNR